MLEYYAWFKMHSQIIGFWLFKRFLTNNFPRFLWEIRPKIFQRKCSLGSSLSHHWGKIHQEDGYMESRMYFTLISYRENSLALKAFLTVAPSHVLYRQKARNTLNSCRFTWKYTIINFKLSQQGAWQKTTSLIIIKTKNFQSKHIKTELIFYRIIINLTY